MRQLEVSLQIIEVNINRIDYCQFLLSSQKNMTATSLADHSRGVYHDATKRLLQHDKPTGHIIWEHSQGDIALSPGGCLVFDDSVLDKTTPTASNCFACNTAAMRMV